MGIEAMRKRSNFLWTVLTYLLVFLLVFPVLWMVITGFKTEIAAITIPPTLFFQPTLDQFQIAFQGGFGAYLFNSAVASLVSTAIAMVLGIPAAYAMVFQMRKKSSESMLFFVLSTRFLPFAAILVPLYVIITRLNLLDNLFTLIIVYTSMNLPLMIWMARSYFLDLPKETLEAASIDVCKKLQKILIIVVQLYAPGLFEVVLITN